MEDRKDRVFSETLGQIKPFEFNESVAHVFDDMAGRSIPFYSQVEQMTASLAATFWQEDTAVYDLGCSTATCSLLVYEEVQKQYGIVPGGFEIHAIDSSAPMCTEANEKLRSRGIDSGTIHVRHGDILDIDIKNASVVIMNYTLQFIPPLKREGLIRRIVSGLCENGVLLVSDKTFQTHTDISRIFIDKYYDYKRARGYSELEISQKREALENVLVPYHVKEEETLFLKCGFSSVDIYFSWYNFTSFICVKR
ncbi:MAG: carboxy-S-adenosyl-L-methionine synthase CmoA [Spirochaetales bacterium]|nr:carboxy-S-adenosyl-L-methionine synthase CmoA [Spirochaetales bacterium]